MGKPFYVIKEPSGNMLLNVSKCIGNALKIRSRERHTNPRYHWLDYAEAKYGRTLVYDVKCLLKVLVLYIPLPVFWALFDQQGSRWTFQATRMDSHAFSFLSIKPDQMQVINPLLIVFAIPLFNLWIYPLLAKINIKTPLQKLTLGMVLCGVAFAMSGLLELKLEKTYPVLPTASEGQLRIFNGHSCTYTIQTNVPNYNEIIMEPMGLWEAKHIQLNENSSLHFTYNATASGSNCPTNINGQFEIVSGAARSYLIGSNGPFLQYDDNVDKPKKGLPLMRLLSVSDNGAVDNVSLTNSESKSKIENKPNSYQLKETPAGKYLIAVNGKTAGAIELKEGGTYTVLVSAKSSEEYVSRF